MPLPTPNVTRFSQERDNGNGQKLKNSISEIVLSHPKQQLFQTKLLSAIRWLLRSFDEFYRETKLKIEVWVVKERCKVHEVNKETEILLNLPRGSRVMAGAAKENVSENTLRKVHCL